MYKIIRAKTAGFCPGVALALKKLDRLLEEKEEQKKIFTLGPIIHNPQVLDFYRTKGVESAEDLNDISEGCCVIIRAHGVPKEIEEELRTKGVEVVDATCPKVKRAQMLIRKESSKQKILLLFGEKSHPEVKGLLSYATSDYVVFESIEEFKSIIFKLKGKDFFLAAQTTQDRREYNEIVKLVQKEIDEDVVVLDTICDTTRERQQEAVEIAKRVELMIVVGGYNSGNTRRLAKVVSESGCFCIHIESADEIMPSQIKGKRVIGLTAGASTPKDVIDKVEERIKKLLRS